VNDEWFSGEIMVAIWWGTQADEAFAEAWQSDTGGHAIFRSKVYLSPKLWYLRVNVIEAQDLVGIDKGRPPEPVRLSASENSEETPCKPFHHALFLGSLYRGLFILTWPIRLLLSSKI